MALTSGCMLGPEAQRPGEAGRYLPPAFVDAGLDATGSADGAWWRHFEDPTTDLLVAQALAANPDLVASAATVLEAAALRRIAIGNRLPAISAAAGADRSFQTRQAVFPFEGGSEREYASFFSASVEIGWQVDLFGRLRRLQEQRTAEFAASATDHLALAHSLVAEVVRLRAQTSVAARRLTLAEDVIRSRADTLRLIERRYRAGVEAVGAVDVRLARENLAAAEADLPERRSVLDRSRHALATVVGVPAGGLMELEPLPATPPSPPPSVGLPLALLDRRPDLLAEEFRTAAATAGVGVALAELFPDLTLGGDLGVAATELDALFDKDALLGSLVGRVSVPLFRGGALRANVDAARARRTAAAYRYASAVLTAVREVSDALVLEQRLAEQEQRLVRRVEAATAAEALARRRYTQGLESILVVLDTERRRAAAEDNLILVRGERWNARADLHLALGGDWVTDQLEEGVTNASETPDTSGRSEPQPDPDPVSKLAPGRPPGPGLDPKPDSAA